MCAWKAWAASKEGWPAGEGRWFSPSALETPPGVRKDVSLSCEHRLRQLGCPAGEGSGGALIVDFQYFKGAYEMERE